MSATPGCHRTAAPAPAAVGPAGRPAGRPSRTASRWGENSSPPCQIDRGACRRRGGRNAQTSPRSGRRRRRRRRSREPRDAHVHLAGSLLQGQIAPHRLFNFAEAHLARQLIRINACILRNFHNKFGASGGPAQSSGHVKYPEPIVLSASMSLTVETPRPNISYSPESIASWRSAFGRHSCIQRSIMSRWVGPPALVGDAMP